MSAWSRGAGPVSSRGNANVASQASYASSAVAQAPAQPQDLPSLDDLNAPQSRKARQQSSGSAATALASAGGGAQPSTQNAWHKHQPAHAAVPALPGAGAVPDARPFSGHAQPRASGAAEKRSRSAAPFDAYIVLDFEATCEHDKKLPVQEVIEFPMVVVDPETNTVVAEYQRYVRPTHQPTLTAFCTELTGITQDKVNKAAPFETVIAEVLAWLSSGGFADRPGVGVRSYCFVTCGDWDLRTMLPAQLHHCARAAPKGAAPLTVPRTFNRWINIKHLFESVMQRPSRGGMTKMLEALRLPLLGRHHSGIDDCRNIAQILTALLKRGDPASILPTSCERDFQPWRGGQACDMSWPVSSVVDVAPACGGVEGPVAVAATHTQKQADVGAAAPAPSPALQILLASPPPKRAPNVQEKTTFSKKLSLVLRHRAEDFGLTMTAAGLVRVDDLLTLPHFKHLDLYTLGCLVRDCPKQRFRVVVAPEDKTTLWIGANQGHSLPIVDADLKPITDAAQCPMAVHGTYRKAWPLIVQSGGLSRMARQHVHFAKGLPGASEVKSGMRSSAEVLVYLNVPKMLRDKVPLFESQNGVILSPGVGDSGMIPLSYVERVEDARTRQPITF